jgi:hypothetical protein
VTNRESHSPSLEERYRPAVPPVFNASTFKFLLEAGDKDGGCRRDAWTATETLRMTTAYRHRYVAPRRSVGRDSNLVGD